MVSRHELPTLRTADLLPPVALTVYGSARSRTMRVLWMLEELAIEFQHQPYEFDERALKQPEFLRLNPAGAIPTIVDEGHVLTESLAINLYLAKKYGRGDGLSLYADTIEEESELWQWTLWCQGHLEPWVQKDLLLVELIEAIGSKGQAMIDRSLGVLERVLVDRDWLVGERFTVADLNVAAVLSPSRRSRFDLIRYPNVADWLARCYSRPAAIESRRKYAKG